MDFLIVTKAPGVARLRVHCTRIVEVQTRHTFARWFMERPTGFEPATSSLGRFPSRTSRETT
jgi:hypothetical protein